MSTDKEWIWSPQQGDYYRAVRRLDGSIERYEWGRATIPEPQPRPQSHTHSYPPNTAYAPQSSSPPSVQGATYGGEPQYTYTPSASGSQPHPQDNQGSWGRTQGRDEYQQQTRPEQPRTSTYQQQQPQLDAWGRPIPTTQHSTPAYYQPSQPPQETNQNQPPASTYGTSAPPRQYPYNTGSSQGGTWASR